ncbi:MAG: YdeI/OmpD-associated family protein [Sandaracinaceae bacterium]|nr:YdeI/OmpD-associated family protein [Sandaracinaceae bacterium]
MERFEGELEPVPHGGCFVVVPTGTAKKAGLKHGDRVCGEVNGAPYRSALMKYSGVFHLGVHKATLTAAKKKLGDQVKVTIEKDDAPLPGDVVPDDLAQALADAGTTATWEKMAPSHRREWVKSVEDAKRADTRARRIAKCVEEMTAKAR